MRSDCHVYYIVLMTCPLIFYHSVTRIARPGKTNLISSNNHLDSESSVPPPVPLKISLSGVTLKPHCLVRITNFIVTTGRC